MNKNKILRFRFIILLAVIIVFIFDICSVIYEAEEFLFAFFAITSLMYGLDMIGFWKILLGSIGMVKSYIKMVWKKICGVCSKPFSKSMNTHKSNHVNNFTRSEHEPKQMSQNEEGIVMAVAKKKVVKKKVSMAKRVVAKKKTVKKSTPKVKKAVKAKSPKAKKVVKAKAAPKAKAKKA